MTLVETIAPASNEAKGDDMATHPLDVNIFSPQSNAIL
jgi:hypothetical protein